MALYLRPVPVAEQDEARRIERNDAVRAVWE